MKTKIYLIFIISVFLASCSSLQQTTVNDDLYYSPTDEYVASTDVDANPSYDNNQSISINEEYDQEISDILEDDSKENIDTTIVDNKESENVYDRLIVDDYQEAYNKRLEAKKSPYYGMSTYNIYFNDDYLFASMFFNDPYYNVVIVGDQVWVEPYYISSSFYYWGRPYYRSSWYYSPWYNSYPYYSYYSPYYNSPYYYNPYYNPYYYPYSVNYNYYYGNQEEQWAGSAYNSYRRRSLGAMSNSGVSANNQRASRNREYLGRDITPASSVKSGIDNMQDGRTVRRTEATSSRRDGNPIDSRETIRIVDNTDSRVVRGYNRQDPPERRTSVSETSSRTRTYTRSGESNRSTYNATRRTTRYSRPASTSNTNSGVKRSSSGNSTYTPSRSSRTNNSGSSRSYTPRRSSGSSGSSGTSVRSSGSSTRSSGSSSSSGSSRSSSSGRRR
ncbi:MAG: hypothetical protein ACLFVR_00865 [Thiohalospira sp.]